MTRATYAFWHWLLLETEAGVSWLVTNCFGLGRTGLGLLVEFYFLDVPGLSDWGGRAINTIWDQGTDLFLQALRKRLKNDHGWDRGWRAWLFDTVFLTSVKVPVYIACLWLAGMPWSDLRWIIVLNIAMFVVSARPNCKVIDRVLERNRKA